MKKYLCLELRRMALLIVFVLIVLLPLPSLAGNATLVPEVATENDLIGITAGEVELESNIRGDCNGNGEVTAADISAVTLEIFDGDGDGALNTLGGTYPGDPVGCDANGNEQVATADISCTVLIVLNGPGACDSGSPPIATPHPYPYPAPEPEPTPDPYPYPSPSNPTPLPSTGAQMMGVEINRGHVASVVAKAGEAKVSWVRYNGILWSDVEAVRGTRNWHALSHVEAELAALSAQGVTPIVIVRGTPEWAQKVSGAFCGPIQQDAFSDFAAFMGELVTRYSGPPYNVKYWEMGNEPDVDPSLIAATEPFGCWGEQNDAYYGGGHYAEMLRAVYPAVKRADPTAQVILGGLMLDCDPTQPPAGKDCLPSKFLEGVLRHGGGEAFDIVAYHAYANWHPAQIDADREHANWQHRGGAMVGKLDFIREQLAHYNVDKPIQMNEGGLLCHESNDACPSDAFTDAQANYIPRFYARAWANGLQNAVWYTLNGPGWRHAGLLDETGNPRPTYRALSFMANLLQNATYQGPLSDGALEGYAFDNPNTTIQLYWSNNAQTHTLTLPAGTQTVYNKLGEPQPFTDTITVGVEPILIELLK